MFSSSKMSFWEFLQENFKFIQINCQTFYYIFHPGGPLNLFRLIVSQTPSHIVGFNFLATKFSFNILPFMF